MRYFVTIEGEEHVVDVSSLPGGGFEARPVVKTADGEQLLAPIPAQLSRSGGLTTVHLGGKIFDLELDGEIPGSLEVYAGGQRASLSVETARSRAAATVRGQKPGGADAGTIKSPMPGKVVKLLVSEGQTVEPGQPIVVVEAMKMENELAAETAGRVTKIYAQAGDAVEGGAKLVTISPLEG